jgi:iron complex transport system substrate-binding protein
MRARVVILFIAGVVLLSGACRTPEPQQATSAAREVKDDLGRTVRVPEKIDRVISLAPSLTEMIFAAGAGDKLVGVTTYCDYPAAASVIEKVGDTQTPNIERIIALRPQIVFISTASQLEAFSKTLGEQGIAVYVTNPKTLNEVFANVRQIGDLLGTSKQADEAANALTVRAHSVWQNAKYDGDTSETAQSTRPRVFIQISNDPLFTIGSESFLTRLIEQAGGVSATKDVPTGYPKLSKETAAALDPDVIILSDSEDNLETNAAFKDSKAVKNGRVYRINPDIISRPGPRLVDALEEIASRLKETK